MSFRGSAAGTGRICVTLALSWVAGCDLGPGPSPEPASMEPVAGMDQVGTVSEPLPVRAAVRVLSPKGKPVRGEEVVFSPLPGAGLVSGSSVHTDREGVARVGTWILGTTAGPQALQARVSDLPPFVFHATAKPDAPAVLRAVDGDEQTGVVGAPPAVQPSVRVSDRFGNPVGGVAVAFQVMEGGGSLSGATSDTDEAGVAHAPSWTLGTAPGANVLSAALANSARLLIP